MIFDSSKKIKIRKYLVAIYNKGKFLNPFVCGRELKTFYKRRVYENKLAAFDQASGELFTDNVLIDAQWDNPNYWIRYALLRASLGLKHGNEVGLLGKWRTAPCCRTLKRLGIKNIINFKSFKPRISQYNYAKKILASVNQSADILKLKLPYDVPAELLYDSLLKKHRCAEVDVSSASLTLDVADELANILSCAAILDFVKPKLVVLSHVIHLNYGPIGWIAAKRGIPVIVAFGEFGSIKFWRVDKPEDIFRSKSVPQIQDVCELDQNKKDRLLDVGAKYIKARLGGKYLDYGSVYAYRKRSANDTRQTICEKYGWDSAKKIITLYGSNWFDFPHALRMSSFRDFKDWILSSYEVMENANHVNWLIRGHPGDNTKKYGGVSMRQLLTKKLPSHIKFAADDLSGTAVVGLSDGFVTFHGTIGLEASAIGKPVLVADRGWYHDFGIACYPKNRKEYLDALSTDWWKSLDLQYVAKQAGILAGIYFCSPEWQGDFVFGDDSDELDNLYEKNIHMLNKFDHELTIEVECIKSWWQSGARHYHVYKMLNSDGYKLHN